MTSSAPDAPLRWLDRPPMDRWQPARYPAPLQLMNRRSGSPVQTHNCVFLLPGFAIPTPASLAALFCGAPPCPPGNGFNHSTPLGRS